MTAKALAAEVENNNNNKLLLSSYCSRPFRLTLQLDKNNIHFCKIKKYFKHYELFSLKLRDNLLSKIVFLQSHYQPNHDFTRFTRCTVPKYSHNTSTVTFDDAFFPIPFQARHWKRPESVLVILGNTIVLFFVMTELSLPLIHNTSGGGLPATRHVSDKLSPSKTRLNVFIKTSGESEKRNFFVIIDCT